VGAYVPSREPVAQPAGAVIGKGGISVHTWLARSVTVLAVLGAALAPMAFSSGSALAAPTGTIYESIPNPLPGNVPSQAFEATSTSEFGDAITFSIGSARTLGSVTLTLSSWGCTSGNWFNDTCSTTPGATFSEPINFNIYQNGSGDSVGSLIATKTQTFSIPYRPSDDDVRCPPSQDVDSPGAGRWYSTTDHACYHGLATNVTFDFSSQNVTLPNSVTFGIAYNTSDYGYNPYGDNTACHSTTQGCGYDSLNVGLSADLAGNPVPPTIGMDNDSTRAYLNSSYGGSYCDGGADGTGRFRLDSPSNGCWFGYTPAVQFVALVLPPTSKDQCKDGGWQQFNNPTFKNQGDCVSYVATHGKHG